MASEWETVRLEDIAATDRRGFAMGPFGSNIKSVNYKPYGIPVLRGVNLSETGFSGSELVYISEEKAEELKNSQAFPGDLVFVAQGTVGKVGLVPDLPGFRKTVLSQNLMKFSCDFEKADPRFLYFFFTSFAGKQMIMSHVNPTGVPCISQPLSSLKKFEVPLPPLPEQKAIAQILGSLDDMIELNRRMNATLEAMARAIFKSWFVDFDPVRAKMDGRQPAGMDAATAAIFPAHFQDSPLGPIPQGWEVRTMSEVIEVNPRRTLKSGVIAPYLDMKNMPTQGHAADEIIEREFTSGTKFQNGDTLLARITPCLENGKTAFVDFLKEGQVGWGSTEYIVLAPKPPLTPEFGYYLTRSESFRAHAIQNMIGTSGRQRVPSDCFGQFLLAIPPAKIAALFGEITRPLMTNIHANSEQSHTLATLRKTVLPKLLSGEQIINEHRRRYL